MREEVKGGLSAQPGRRRAMVLQAIGGYVITGIAIVQGLLLIPLYLHHIGAHMYGFWLASGGMLGLLGLMDMGISNLVIQKVARAYGRQRFDQAGTYFINGIVVYLLICMFYAVAGWAASIWLPDLLKVEDQDVELLRSCFQLAVVAMVFGILNGCMRGFSQALLRPVFPMLSLIGSQILGIIVTVVLLFQGLGLWAIPVGMLVHEGLSFCLNTLNSMLLVRKLGAPIIWDRSMVQEYLRTGPALVMARLGNTLSQESQPLLIATILSPEITTAYMVTRRAADIVARMLNVIVGSSMGSFAHLAGEGDDSKTAGIAGRLLAISASMGLIGFATYVGANSLFVSVWVGEKFVLGQVVILFVGIALFVRVVRGMMGQLFYGLGDFVYPSMIILLESLLGLGLSVVLLHMIGVAGVPVALMASGLLAMALLGFRLATRLPSAIHYLFILKLLLLGLIFFGLGMGPAYVGMAVDSWADLILFAAALLAGFTTIYALMNWQMSREILRRVVRRT